jgi:hypothetical protein
MESDIAGKLIDNLHVAVDAALKHPEPIGVCMCFTFDEVDIIVDVLERAYPRIWENIRIDKKEDIENHSPYEATVEGMLSPDYKERFKAEYQQTKIRYEKLKAFCSRIEAAMRTCPGDTKRVQMPEHDCPLDLLHDQLRAMGDYLHCLEIRAVIEGIEL